MSTLATLAELVVGTQSGAIAPRTLDRLRLHLFDTLGASLAGRSTLEGQALAISVPVTRPMSGRPKRV